MKVTNDFEDYKRGLKEHSAGAPLTLANNKQEVPMNRILIATTLSVTLLAAAAGYADSTSPKANHNPATPAVVTADTPSAAEPAAGSNSFTEKQVTQRLVEQGYTNIKGLKNDSDGIWRGTATMKKTKQNVAVDYQGNITAQ